MFSSRCRSSFQFKAAFFLFSQPSEPSCLFQISPLRFSSLLCNRSLLRFQPQKPSVPLLSPFSRFSKPFSSYSRPPPALSSSPLFSFSAVTTFYLPLSPDSSRNQKFKIKWRACHTRAREPLFFNNLGKQKISFHKIEFKRNNEN